MKVPLFKRGARRARDDKWLKFELSVEINCFEESPLVPLESRGNEEYNKFHMNYSG